MGTGGMETERLVAVMGDEGIGRLARSRVLVLGLGGVGAACAEALARGGVGSLVLLDGDEVRPSNVNRQALAFESTVGMRKVLAMERMVTDVNPAIDVTTADVFLDMEGIEGSLAALPRPDFVIDALDTIAPKLAVASWCQERGIPLVSCMGAANKYDPTMLRFADVSETSVCPMCKVMRRECRRRGIGPLRVLFSTEPPLRLGSDEASAPRLSGRLPEKSGALLGTTSYLPPIMGLMLAGDAICSIADVGPGRRPAMPGSCRPASPQRGVTVVP
jgi:tRNA A37 threonylcarbamoyladenosine dehydratase